MKKTEKAMFALYNHLAAGEPLPEEERDLLLSAAWDYLTLELTLDQAFGEAEVAKGPRNRNIRSQLKFDVGERIRPYMERGETVPWEELATDLNMSKRKLEGLWKEDKAAEAKLEEFLRSGPAPQESD